MNIPKNLDYFLWQENEQFYFLAAGIKQIPLTYNLWLYDTNMPK